jgi:glycine cleavage system H protein
MEETGLRFSEEHVWVLEMGQSVRLGLSDYGQEQLGEILTATLGEIGKFLEPGDTFSEVESQMTVVELPSPVTGTIRSVNENLLEDPTVINVDPYGKGWLVELEIEDAEELERLMGFEEYESFTEE